MFCDRSENVYFDLKKKTNESVEKNEKLLAVKVNQWALIVYLFW